jgi:AraC-like DNA-binding protein
MPEKSLIQPFDPLSQALDALGLRARLVARVEASGRWGIALQDGSPAFHAGLSGSARVNLAGGKGIDLVGGDLLFILDGKKHEILSHRRQHAVPLEQLVKKNWQGDRSVLVLGDGPVQTVLVCGNFDGNHRAIADLLGTMPDHLLLSKAQFTTFDAVGAALNLLEIEAGPGKPGAAIICARLVELLLAYGIRHWLETTPEQGESWLRGLLDPQISKALTLMHSDIGAQWSVPRLAEAVSMSRSAFAARFLALVGVPPAKHLVRWRMLLARDMLSRGQTIAEVAKRLGYRSESSFSRAFTREVGSPPSHQRSKPGQSA